MSSRIILLVILPVLLAGCAHMAEPLDEAAAKEYGEDLMRRTAAPEDLPRHNFSLYKGQIGAKIRTTWREVLAGYPHLKEEGNVLVSFKVYPNGMVSEVKALTGQEHPKLVEVAQRVIHQASPFPAWPEDAKKVVQDNFYLHQTEFAFRKARIDPIDRPAPRIAPDPSVRRIYVTPPSSR